MQLSRMKCLSSLLMIGLVWAGGASAKPKSSEDAQFRRWLIHYLKSDKEDDDLQNLVYGYALVDLNGDGRNEAVVWARDRDNCGSSGCGLEVFVHGKSGWREAIDGATTRPPIKILPTKTRGWRDLSSLQYGGGIDHPYEAWWHYNGRGGYDSSKTEWIVPKRIHGRVIIKDANIPLFPTMCHRTEEASSVFGPMPIKSAKAGSC